MSGQSGTWAGGARSPEHRQMGRKHIFAINDSPAFLDVVRQLLQDEDCNVTTTNYVPRTYEQIAALAPDLLLLDLAIGQRAGWGLLEHLHAEAATRAIPVLVTSTDPHLLAEAEAAGRARRRPLPEEAARPRDPPRRRPDADRGRLTAPPLPALPAQPAGGGHARRPRGTGRARTGTALFDSDSPSA